MQKVLSTNQNPNYKKLSPYLPKQQFDESYALLSHYIQLQQSSEAAEYKRILDEHGVDTEQLPTTESFNKEFDIPFPTDEKANFTFIDLFAGIGGFHLAMQKLGGRCVFSSEWDDAAKQTYFENYGEVPFGDITKPETKALIPASTRSIKRCGRSTDPRMCSRFRCFRLKRAFCPRAGTTIPTSRRAVSRWAI